MDELLQCLKNQKSVFTHSRDINDSAVKASYLIAYEIALSSTPITEDEFTKTCMLRAAEVPKKRQAFANTGINLTRNTIVDRISDLSANLKSQSKNKTKNLLLFQLQLMKARTLQCCTIGYFHP